MKIMKDNRGITLTELITVIAIVGILAGATVLGANILGFGKAKSAAGRVSSMLDFVQIENMTKKDNYYMVIEKVDGNYILSARAVAAGPAGDKIISSAKLSLGNGEVVFQVKGNTKQFLLSDTPVVGRDTKNKLEVGFEKDTGKVIAGRPGDIVEVIRITSSRKTYSIRLVEMTGKHYLE